MEKQEAVNIATRYLKHAARRKRCRKQGDIKGEYFHHGLMQMALQIFEEFSRSHGFGSPENAIKWGKLH